MDISLILNEENLTPFQIHWSDIFQDQINITYYLKNANNLIPPSLNDKYGHMLYAERRKLDPPFEITS